MCSPRSTSRKPQNHLDSSPFPTQPQYWGKRDTNLILPTNDSLSVTLDQDHLSSVTTVRSDPSFTSPPERLWLNGVEEEIGLQGRLRTCIDEMRKFRREKESQDASLPKLSEWGVHICSENNFPTAAGLASSASGFAALVYTLGTLFELQPTVDNSQLSRIARQGSGSACRSLFGGFVAWERGSKADGSDSLAFEVAPREHWPDLQALICVVSDAKKRTPSTAGMQRTVATSPLLQHRIRDVVPKRMTEISAAIRSKDFDTFASITMADSNNFHATCLDTTPPIFYMNDVSRAIVQLIEELNRASESEGRGKVAAYTYDAGPNAVLYALREKMPVVLRLIRHYFPNTDFDDTVSRIANTEGRLDAAIDPLIPLLRTTHASRFSPPLVQSTWRWPQCLSSGRTTTVGSPARRLARGLQCICDSRSRGRHRQKAHPHPGR